MRKPAKTFMEYNMDEKARADNRLRQQRYRELHREELNEKRRERYTERKEKNLCPRCGGKVKKGVILCADCLEYQSKLNKLYPKDTKAAKKTAAKKSAKPVKKIAAPKKAVKKTAVKAKPAKKAAPKTVKKTAKK